MGFEELEPVDSVTVEAPDRQNKGRQSRGFDALEPVDAPQELEPAIQPIQSDPSLSSVEEVSLQEEKKRNVVVDGLSSFAEGVKATPQYMAEMGVGMLTFLPSIASKMSRQAIGAMGRMPEPVQKGIETIVRTQGAYNFELPEETSEETAIKAQEIANNVHNWLREFSYLGMAPEIEGPAREALELSGKAFGAPREYLFAPVGQAYGMLVNDKVSGEMATDALETLFFFAAVPKVMKTGKTKIAQRRMNRAWEKAAKRDLARQEKVARLEEGKTRQQYYEEGSVKDIFGEEAARTTKEGLEARNRKEIADRLKQEELEARQQMYESLFNEKDTMAFLKEVEDFALRREQGLGEKISKQELDRQYQQFMERRASESLTFEKDHQRWRETKQRLDDQGVEAAPYPFIEEAGMVARAEGSGAVSELKFGIASQRQPRTLQESRGYKGQPSLKEKMEMDPLIEKVDTTGQRFSSGVDRPWPKEKTGEPGIVTTEQPRTLQESRGYKGQPSLKKKMALEVSKANRQRKGAKKDPLAEGEVRPVGEGATGKEKSQLDTLGEMGLEVIEAQGKTVKDVAPKKAKTVNEVKAETGAGSIRDVVDLSSEITTTSSQSKATGIPTEKSDLAIEITKNESRVNLIKERHEILKEKKYKDQLRERIKESDLPAEDQKFYTDLVDRDPDFVDQVLQETSSGKGKSPEAKRVSAAREVEDFLLGEDQFNPQDSFFIDTMRQERARPIDQITKDFGTLLGETWRSERGSISFKELTGEQKLAAERLVRDISVISRNAKRTGKTIQQYLVDLKEATPEVAQALEKYADDTLHRDKISVDSTTPQVGKPKRTGEAKVSAEASRAGDPRRVNRMFEMAEKAKEERIKADRKKRLKKIKETLIDRNESITEFFQKDSSKEAEFTHNEFLGVAGSNAKAKRYFNTVRDTIYKHLDTHERTALDQLVFVTKELDIAKRHPKHNHPTGTNANDFQLWFKTAKEQLKLSDESMRKVEQSARDYFDTWRDILDIKYQNDAIPTWLYDLLKENTYSPTRWLYMLDVHNWSANRGGGLSSGKRPPTTFEEFQVRATREMDKVGKNLGPENSTIQRLKRGYKGYQEMNSQALLASGVGETFNWVAKNKATKGLQRYINRMGEGEVLRNAEISRWVQDKGGEAKPYYKKPPKGYKPIHYFEKGQRKTIWAKDWFAEQWKISGSEFRNKYAGILRVATGAPILRAMTTGIGAPFFFIKGLALDTGYSQMAAMYKTPEGKYKSLYGIEPVLPSARMARNIAKVTPDVFLRKGRFVDYINEYGGFNAITETGGLGPKARGKLLGGLDMLNDWGTYLNRTSEYLIRIANREQYIKRGYTPEQASIMARRVIDFHQGGEVAKFIDNAIPYTNVSIQAARGLLGAAKKNKLEMAIKVAKLGSIASSLYAYNKIRHPEAIEEESNHNKSNYFIFPSGYSFTDARGNKRHMNFKVRKDPEQRAIATLAELVTARAMGEEADFKRALVDLKDSIPYVESLPLPPFLAGAVTYTTNTDLLTLEKVWRGEAAGTEEWYSERTSQLWKDAGEAIGASPERLKASMETVIGRDSLPAKLVEGAYDKVFRDLPKPQQETMLAQFLINNWASPAVSLTRKSSKYRDEFDELSLEETKKRLAQNTLLDALARGYYKDGTAEWEDISKFFRSLDSKEDMDRMDKRLKHYIETMNLPEQNMWLMIGSMSTPKAKAEALYEWWSEAEGEERVMIDRTMLDLQESSSDIIPKDFDSTFWREFDRLRVEGE